MNTLPTLFLSHGSPMHAIQQGWASEAWLRIAARIGRPDAILMASAHWETATPRLTATPRPATIHDFGGFPQALYEIDYPAPGSPDLAERAGSLLAAGGIPATLDDARGLDHGAWVPLLHMYPQADVPVVQLSLQSHLPARHALEVGRLLEPLTREGILVVGSGHMTHNLRDWFSVGQRAGVRSKRTPATGYVREFTAWIDAALRAGGERIAAWQTEAPHAHRAHPSDEHFLPLPLAYAAAGADPTIEHIDVGTDNEVLAMDAYLFTPRH